ncbi:AIS_collapsed_G0018080.mRNA.1.CDS.1 [Saccharomyces cerevisiae]|nr:AIS_collapsed_G0018080.mRNA.1.CDS.1 [Saccharomyces cerevisiae]
MDTEGASLSEQLLDAARRNNLDFLETVFDSLDNDPEKIAKLINESKEPLGNTALHLCCKYGSWEVLDKILDQDGEIEIDPQNDVDGDTPLHVTVRYSQEEPEHGTFIARNLIEVVDLVHGDELDELIDLLQGAELAIDSTNGPGDNNEDGEMIDDGPSDDDEEDDKK